VLIMSEQAAAVIEQILAESEAGPEAGLRITGSADGDGNASLEFEVAEGPVEGDEVVREGGAAVFLDLIAAAALDDKTLDVEAHGDHFHFSLGEQDEAD
jgi:Fe-S cluster assembly iron-binding protein IscA